ncbi:MAG: hypothetical protein Q7S84_03795 [bacterium]|nr:hypothetical protein [bacterium]
MVTERDWKLLGDQYFTAYGRQGEAPECQVFFENCKQLEQLGVLTREKEGSWGFESFFRDEKVARGLDDFYFVRRDDAALFGKLCFGGFWMLHQFGEL